VGGRSNAATGRQRSAVAIPGHARGRQRDPPVPPGV